MLFSTFFVASTVTLAAASFKEPGDLTLRDLGEVQEGQELYSRGKSASKGHGTKGGSGGKGKRDIFTRSGKSASKGHGTKGGSGGKGKRDIFTRSGKSASKGHGTKGGSGGKGKRDIYNGDDTV